MNIVFWAEAAKAYPASLMGILMDLAPWLFLGLVMAGLVQWIFPARRVLNWLGAGRRFAVLRAALLGVPLPLCSCGVVPVALALRRRGAGRAATVAFLVTTPQSGADSIAATWGLMGAPFAIARALLTFVTGLAAGWTVQATVPEAPRATLDFEPDPPAANFLSRLLGPGWSILVSIHRPLIWGILLATAVSVAVPTGAVQGIWTGFAGMLLMVAIALPLYVCATSSIPLALQLVDKGFSPGAAFVFLLVGPAVSLASALIIRREIGNRAMAAYLGALIAFGLAAGWTIDMLGINFGGKGAHDHGAHGTASTLWGWALAVVLLYLWAKGLWPVGKESMSEHVLDVKGMTCDHCRQTVARATGGVTGVHKVTVDLAGGRLFFDGGDVDAVRRAVTGAGFDVT